MINAVSNWTASLASIGIPPSTNPNAGTTMGGFITTSSINPANWTRSYSRSAYIDPLPPRSNLQILPESTVVRVVLSNDTDSSGNLYAMGIEFAQNPAAPRVTVGVLKEIILAGGALGSPKILMHSGVGPADVLANASVPLTLELPGVGQHLQDHLVCILCTTVPYHLLILFRLPASFGMFPLKLRVILPALAPISLCGFSFIMSTLTNI